jgi:hypothetical protein
MRDFWPREIRRVKDEYPDFELRDREPRLDLDQDEAARCGPTVRTWSGVMRPFPPTLAADELRHIISDLYEGTTAVSIGLNGSLRHNANCPRRDHPVEPHLVPRRPLHDAYEMEIAYTVPPMRPIVRALNPMVTIEQCPKMPQPIAPLKALCVANAPTDPWNLESDGARLYLDWAAYFMGKHTLWLECFDRVGQARWPGRSRPGDPNDEVMNNPPDAPCTCNSEIPYRDCHRQFDLFHREWRRRGHGPIPRPMGMEFFTQARAASAERLRRGGK